MIRLPHVTQTQARIIALGAAVVVFALTVWASSNLPQFDARSGDTEEDNAGAAYEAEYQANVTPAAYRTSSTPQKSRTTARCSPWDISPEAMEAVLQEMVRRGWRPPTSDVALESTQPRYRLPIEALNPGQPVWVSSPRGAAPTETGDLVDVTITENEEAAATPATATPASLPLATPSVAIPPPASVQPEAPIASPPATDPAPPTN